MVETIFISQPFTGKTEEEIIKERENIVEWLKKIRGGDYIIIDQYHQSEPPVDSSNMKRVWYLGNSIRMMSTADLVVFSENWALAKGCVIEHKVVDEYGIKYIELTKGWSDILK